MDHNVIMKKEESKKILKLNISHSNEFDLFAADQTVNVWSFKCRDLRGGGQIARATRGFWSSVPLRRWGAVTVWLFDLEPRGTKHWRLWRVQVVS